MIHSKIGKSFLVDEITKAASRNMLYHFGFAAHLLTPWMSVAQVTKQIWSYFWMMLAAPHSRFIHGQVRSPYTFEAPMVSALHKILWVPGIWVTYKVMFQKQKITYLEYTSFPNHVKW